MGIRGLTKSIAQADPAVCRVVDIGEEIAGDPSNVVVVDGYGKARGCPAPAVALARPRRASKHATVNPHLAVPVSPLLPGLVRFMCSPRTIDWVRGGQWTAIYANVAKCVPPPCPSASLSLFYFFLSLLSLSLPLLTRCPAQSMPGLTLPAVS